MTLSGVIQPEDLGADLITQYTEWAAAHADFLNVVIITIILVTVGGIAVAYKKRRWVAHRLKDHTTIEKWFIISFFVTAIGGVFFSVVLLGFLALQSTDNLIIPLVGMVILSLLVIPGILTCFVTFLILTFRLFVYKEPAAPKISEMVNWGGVPVLVVFVAFFLGSILLSFGSGVIGSVVGSVLLIVLPVYLVVVTYGRSVDVMGFTLPVWKMFFLTLPLIPGIILGGEAIYWVTEKLIGEFPLEEIVEYTIKESPVIMSVHLAVIGPVGEEIFFRGFAYSALKRKYGFRKGLIYSSLFFGVYHIIPWQIPYAVVAGCILAYVYEKTKSIYTCFVLHIVNNAVAVIMFWM